MVAKEQAILNDNSFCVVNTETEEFLLQFGAPAGRRGESVFHKESRRSCLSLLEKG